MPTLTLSNVSTGIPYTFTIQYLLIGESITQPNETILLTSQNDNLPIAYPEGVTVPSKITNISNTLNTGEIVLHWSPPNDNGKPILGYVIWGVDNGTLFVLGVASQTVNTARISTVNTTTTYKLAVSAINEVGVGQPSEIIRVAMAETIPCLVEGQEILTASGFKCVQDLTNDDRIITSDGRAVAFKLYTTYLSKTTKNTAPYYIPAHVFGKNSPSVPIVLSPLHAIQINKGKWQIPKYAALKYSSIKQINVGNPVRYYHIELPNYFTDNLVAKGDIILESYGNKQVKCMSSVYKYNVAKNIFTRNNTITSLYNKL